MRIAVLLGVHVAAADEQDRDGAKNLLERVLGWYGRLAILWADSAYAGHLVDWVKSLRPRGRLHLEIVRRDPKVNGFAVLPKRWVVERTFAWLGKYRRLTRDYECKTSHSEALIYIAMSNLMLRRLARSQQN
jgi:putative transposase